MKNKFSLKTEYKKSFYYIRDSKNYIYGIIGIFFLFLLVGFFVPVPESLSEKIMEFIRELIGKTENMSHFELIEYIFLNNLQSSFFGMVLGVFFGLFPLITAIANGFLLGYVALISVDSGGFSVLLRLLPHGVFELPAIFISLGLGLKLGTFIFQKNKVENFRNYFWSSIRIFFLIVVPLLVTAAIIEGTLIFFGI